MHKPNHYAGGSLDRAHLLRRDEAWLRERLTDPASLVLPLWRGQPLIVESGGPAPALLDTAAAAAFMRAGEWALLGLREGRALFALDLDAQAPEPEVFGSRGRFTELRQVGPLLAQSDGALLAYARGLMLWHQRHRFCGACGAPTRPAEGGHQRRCTNEACALAHFPRTDPAVIMLVTYGQKALLGRQRDWPPGHAFHSRRLRRAGREPRGGGRPRGHGGGRPSVGEVRYHSSQPWPFPASIMLGFTARALDETIRADPEEIAAAAWFTRGGAARRARGRAPAPAAPRIPSPTGWSGTGWTKASRI